MHCCGVFRILLSLSLSHVWIRASLFSPCKTDFFCSLSTMQKPCLFSAPAYISGWAMAPSFSVPILHSWQRPLIGPDMVRCSSLDQTAMAKEHEHTEQNGCWEPNHCIMWWWVGGTSSQRRASVANSRGAFNKCSWGSHLSGGRTWW